MAGRVSCVYAYLSTSTLSPDFNSTVQWSSHIVICLSQRFTRASSNTVRSEDWSLMKSCNSVMRCSCSSRCTVSIEAWSHPPGRQQSSPGSSRRRQGPPHEQGRSRHYSQRVIFQNQETRSIDTHRFWKAEHRCRSRYQSIRFS